MPSSYRRPNISRARRRAIQRRRQLYTGIAAAALVCVAVAVILMTRGGRPDKSLCEG